MRKMILSYGGEIRFESQVTDFLFDLGEDGEKELRGVEVNGGEVLPCEVCVLAIGHSARVSHSMPDESTYIPQHRVLFPHNFLFHTERN